MMMGERMSHLRTILFAASILVLGCASAGAYDVAEKSIATLNSDLARHRVTSVALVKAYLAQIDHFDRNGPELDSIISINPEAISIAKTLDEERAAGRLLGPLHGIPILIKDNIESRDSLATTAGSLALKDNVTGRDSPLVARLRAAGAIVLGKTNLSEWAGMRSPKMSAGWSAIGGLTRNPYARNRSACGSSSGSAVATSMSFAAAAIGTETDGSIVCPASVNGVVGMKPTTGLIPRNYIVPISTSWDTPGPIARTVADAALLLSIMAGSDTSDPATAEASAKKQDYLSALDNDALRSARIGIVRPKAHAAVNALFDRAVAILKNAGAIIIDAPPFKPDPHIGPNEFRATLTELKSGLDSYLGNAAPAVKTRSLRAVIQFDIAHRSEEMALFGQEWFEQAEQTKGLDDAGYRAARDTAIRLSGPEGIDELLADDKLDAIVSPSFGPAWIVHLGKGDRGADLTQLRTLAALSGDPHLTVPMGAVAGLPVGLSFIGPRWSDARILALGYAYEQRSHARRPPSFQ